jgi:hypothetical protein
MGDEKELHIIAWMNEKAACELAGMNITNNPCVEQLGDGMVAIWSGPIRTIDERED